MMKLQKKMDVFGIIFECSEPYKIFFSSLHTVCKSKRKKDDGRKKKQLSMKKIILIANVYLYDLVRDNQKKIGLFDVP